jgi:glycerol-3-phosphate acyltransferase PlsX
VFAKVVLGLPAPTIGLLNIGSEDGKGDEILNSAAATLRESPIAKQFHGFVEGHDIAAGTVDVVVTDGFTGNVALKTGEGALRLVADLLKRVFSSGPFARAGYVLARGGLNRLKDWLDPRRYNGAVLLGLNGVVVKSHGGTDAQGFAHAVDVALDMIGHDFLGAIAEGLAAMDRAMLAEPIIDA